MRAKTDIKENHIAKCSVLVITGHGNLRSGLEALLRSLPQVGPIYLAENHRDAGEIIESEPINLVILDKDYLGDNFSGLLGHIHHNEAHAIVLGDWENSPQEDTEIYSYVIKGVRPEQLVEEIQKRCWGC